MFEVELGHSAIEACTAKQVNWYRMHMEQILRKFEGTEISYRLIYQCFEIIKSII